MRKGAFKNYKSGPKNNWRRTVWNELLLRTAGQEKQKPILYLAGPQDLDRDVATSKGVPNQNMIAIDRDRGNATKVRAEGAPAIIGDALDILWSWPDSTPPAAVFLDFCSGIEYDNLGIYDAFERHVFSGAVIAINLMRGRDKWSNPIRSRLSDAGLLLPLWAASPTDDGEVELLAEPKHRGYQYLLYHAVDTLLAVGLQLERTSIYPPGTDEHNILLSTVSKVLMSMEPKFFSYRSGVLVFDSVVFRHPLNKVGMLRDEVPGLDELLGAQMQACDEKRRSFRNIGLVRRIAATLAVRTMRRK